MDFKVGEVEINNNCITLIAEAGVNHNGNLESAFKLASAAKETGAQIVKFQTYKAEKLSSQQARKFWNKTGDQTKFQVDTYSSLDSFGYSDYKELSQFCKDIGIEFMSTPFDLEAVHMLFKLGVKAFKIASCDITNWLLIEEICKTGLPIFLSTGASNFQEIRDCVNLINSYGNDLCIMHCVLSYPTEVKYANLLSIPFLSQNFPGIIMGFSDHTKGNIAPLASVPLGARVIEKHFTLKKDSDTLGDHWFAADTNDFKVLFEESNKILAALGKFERKVLECEEVAREQARRSLFYDENVEIGESLRKSQVIALRPGTGISPREIDSFIGRNLKKKKFKGEMLSESDFT